MKWIKRGLVFLMMVYAPLELTRVILRNLGYERVFYTPVVMGWIEIGFLWGCFIGVLLIFWKVQKE